MTSETANASAAFHTDDVLIGRGERVVKLGFVEIHVYGLEVYVDPAGCRESLQVFTGMDHDDLLRDPSFYNDFTCAHFRKTFRLKFCRSLSKEKMVGAFEEPLKSRCDSEHLPDAEKLLANLVPPEGVNEGDTLSLICHRDGETLTGLYLPKNGGEEQVLISVKSGGEGGAWKALQGIYFDEDTQLPTIRVTAIADLPNVLLADQSSQSQKQPSQKDIETAFEEQLVGKKKTWSEFAGRDPANGGEGYKFGDFTMGVVTALGMRKPSSKSKSRSLQTSTTTTVTRVEIQKLQEQVERLESQNQKFQSQLKSTQLQLKEVDRQLSLTVAVVMALTEAAYIVLYFVADVYFPSSRKFQMYIMAVIGLAGYKYLSDQKLKAE